MHLVDGPWTDWNRSKLLKHALHAILPPVFVPSGEGSVREDRRVGETAH